MLWVTRMYAIIWCTVWWILHERNRREFKDRVPAAWQMVWLRFDFDGLLQRNRFIGANTR